MEKEQLVEEAKFFEACGRYKHLLKGDLEDPAVIERLDRLSELFSRGRYFLHYQKDFDPKDFKHLLRCHQFSSEEAENAMSFAYLTMRIRVKRREELKGVTNLQVAK
jgi:hypothetical protein